MVKKIIVITLISLAVIATGLIIYTAWENNRVTVAEQSVFVEELASSLDDFTIVQVSDLHEKEFGRNQQKLINAINAIDYDVLVFTGDMLDGIESTNYQPFYSLLEGINNKEYAWFIPGNTDPESYQVTDKVVKSEFIQGMEELGVNLLESTEVIQKEGAEIQFVNFELSLIDNVEKMGAVNGTLQPSYAGHPSYLDYRKGLWEEMNQAGQLEDEGVLIALNHYPVVDTHIDVLNNSPGMSFRDYDLIMAGHYHGGQIRIPFYGALFVPEAWYDSGGLFPPKDRVNGLWEYENTQQYVSTGLGSSDAISFLKFRFNNPPEINVLTLKSESK